MFLCLACVTALQMSSGRALTTYGGELIIFDEALQQNVTWFKRSTELVHNYKVDHEMWHNVVFMLCSEGAEDASEAAFEAEAASSSASLDGLVTFRNPYGYIPAELYGVLPFEGARMVAYVLFSCYFIYHYLRNKVCGAVCLI